MERGKIFLWALGLVCTGCPNPNTFTTPRTVPAGSVEHTVSIETIGAISSDYKQVYPTLPSYTARIGLADRLELGLHLSHMTSLGLDFKWNPVKTDVFDLAIDPGAQVFYTIGNASVLVYYLHAPLLLGFNLSQDTTLVLTPGVTLLGVSGQISDGGDDNHFVGGSDSVLLGRIGLGVDIRASKKFAVHPEGTLLKSFEGGDGVVFLIGVGFKFGTQPEY